MRRYVFVKKTGPHYAILAYGAFWAGALFTGWSTDDLQRLAWRTRREATGCSPRVKLMWWSPRLATDRRTDSVERCNNAVSLSDRFGSCLCRWM